MTMQPVVAQVSIPAGQQVCEPLLSGSGALKTPDTGDHSQQPTAKRLRDATASQHR